MVENLSHGTKRTVVTSARQARRFTVVSSLILLSSALIYSPAAVRLAGNYIRSAIIPHEELLSGRLALLVSALVPVILFFTFSRVGRLQFLLLPSAKLFLFLIPFVLLEVLGRPLMINAKTTIFMPDEKAGWRLRPSAEDNYAGVLVRVNSKGLRGPEIAYERTADERRLMFLGNSVTFGFRAYGDDKLFPAIAGRMLSEKLKAPVTSINAAIPGYTTWQELDFLKSEALKYSPDVIVLVFTLSDVTQRFVEEGPSAPINLISSPTSLIEVLVDRSATVYIAKFLGAKLRLGSDVQQAATERGINDVTLLTEDLARPDIRKAWEKTQGDIAEFSKTCREQKIACTVAVMPFEFQLEDPERLSRPQRELGEIVRKENLSFIDLLPPLIKKMRERNLSSKDVFLDGSHFTPAGHEIVAESLASELAKELS